MTIVRLISEWIMETLISLSAGEGIYSKGKDDKVLCYKSVSCNPKVHILRLLCGVFDKTRLSWGPFNEKTTCVTYVSRPKLGLLDSQILLISLSLLPTLAPPTTPYTSVPAVSKSISLLGHVNHIPTMQFLTGISRNTQAKSYKLCYHWLRVSGIYKIMHCGILISTPDWTEQGIASGKKIMSWKCLTLTNHPGSGAYRKQLTIK